MRRPTIYDKLSAYYGIAVESLRALPREQVERMIEEMEADLKRKQELQKRLQQLNQNSNRNSFGRRSSFFGNSFFKRKGW